MRLTKSGNSRVLNPGAQGVYGSGLAGPASGVESWIPPFQHHFDFQPLAQAACRLLQVDLLDLLHIASFTTHPCIAIIVQCEAPESCKRLFDRGLTLHGRQSA